MDMNCSPQDCSDQVIRSIQESCLHYAVSETPYSVYVTIRKKFLRTPNQSKLKNQMLLPSDLTSNLLQENFSLKSKNKELERSVGEGSEMCKNFDEKLAIAKIQMSECLSKKNCLEKTLQARLEETESFKTANKSMKAEIAECKSEASKVKKDLKTKDKEIHKLENKVDNLEDQVFKSKAEKSETAREISNLKRELKQLEKKYKKKVDVEYNNNPKSCVSSHSAELSASVTLSNAPLVTSTSSNPSITSLSTPKSGLVCVTPASAPTASSLAIVPSCSNNNPVKPLLDQETSQKSSACYHTPQCCARQPSPPPFGPLTSKQVELNEEIEKKEKNDEEIFKLVMEFFEKEPNDSIDTTILKLEAIKRIFHPNSELEDSASPFDILIQMGRDAKDTIENMKVSDAEDNYDDYLTEDEDIPRHYYGEEGELIFYDDQ